MTKSVEKGAALDSVSGMGPRAATVAGTPRWMWQGLMRHLRRVPSEALFTTGTTQWRSASVRGGTVTVLGQFVRLVVQTGAAMVIARLLSPEDFGLQGEVVAITGIIMLFRDAGLSMATVQRQTITHDETSTLFWINAALGVFLTLLTVAAAPILVAVFHEPRLLSMTLVSASVFSVNGLCVQHQALLQRTLRFTTIAFVDLLSLAISSGVGIGMALKGFGYWALVGMALAAPIVTLVCVWLIVGWTPGRPRRVGAVAPLLVFGGTVSLNMLLMYVATNMSPAFFLGRWWGSEAVGFFTRAYQLVNQPMQQLNNAVFNVAFPTLSRIQHDQAVLCRSFLKGYAIQLAINTPITVCTALFAKEVVRVLLGPAWPAAAPVLVLLTPAILSFSVLNPLGWFMLASGLATRSLIMACVLTPVLIAGIGVGALRGAEGVALGFSLTIVALTLPLAAWAIRGTGITMRQYFTAVGHPLVSGLVAGLVGWVAKNALAAHLKTIPLLVGGSLVVCALYLFMLLVVFDQRSVYVDLVRHFKRRHSDDRVVL